MPSIDLDKQIFRKAFSGARPWGDIQGHQAVSSALDTRRGFDLNANAFAYFSLMKKWGSVRFLSHISAEATVQAQAQTPLNMFREAGLAIRLQAIARLAAGVGLSLDMTVGDLLKLLKQRPEVQGLFGNLLDIFLEEVSLEGALYAQAAIAVMAYANLVVTGSLFRSDEVKEPGFQMVFEMGMGFKAGGGYRVVLDLKMTEARRLVARISDVLVSGLVRSAEQSAGAIRDLASLEAVLKIAVRLAYEIGKALSDANTVTADEWRQRSVQVMVQEAQRWILSQVSSFAVERFRVLLQEANIQTEQSRQFLNLLSGKAAEPVLAQEDWDEILQASENLISSFPEGDKRQQWLQTLSMAWSAVTLNHDAAAHISADTALYTFTGNLAAQPPASVRSWINLQLNQGSEQALRKEDLITFLMGNPLALLLQESGETTAFLRVFGAAFTGTPQTIAASLFSFQGSTPVSAQELLQAVLPEFQSFAGNLLSGQLVPAVRRALGGNPEIAALLDHALLPALQLMNEAVLPEVLRGFQGGTGKQEVQEALSSILLTMIGRNMVILIETVLTAVQQNVASLLNRAAGQISDIMDVLKGMGGGPEVELLDTLLEESLKIVGANLGPFPQDSQARIFGLLKRVVTPLEGYQPLSFMNKLRRPEWVPQQDALEQIGQELAALLFGRMNKISMDLLQMIFKVVLDKVLAELEALIKEFQKEINKIGEYLENLIRTIVLDQLTNLFLVEARRALGFLSLVPQIRDAVERELTNAVKAGVERVILPAVLGPLRTIDFDPGPILDAFRNNGDFDAFKRTITSQLREHVTRQIQSANLGFDLTVPVSIEIPSPIPGLPPFKLKENVRLGRIGPPSAKIVDEVMRAFENQFNFGQLFEVLVRYVVPVFNKEKEIDSLKSEMNALTDQFRMNPRQLYPAAPGSNAPLIFFHLVRNGGSHRVLEAVLHYPGLVPNSDGWPALLAVYLNDKVLPMATFFFEENRTFDASGLPSGLTLRRHLGMEELKPGKNTLSTIALDGYGNRYEMSRSFLLKV